MLDLHCHTEVSIDSQAKLEDYYKAHDIERFCQTDHYEFYPKSQTFDFKDVKSELVGVEFGYNKDYVSEINRLIKDNNIDVVLMSFHNVKVYYDNDNKFFDVSSYFTDYLKFLDEDIDYHILTHLDYPFRYFNTSLTQLKENSELIKNVLIKIKEKNKYLELNTSSIYRKGTKDLMFYMFDLYYNNGGRKISLGSDCHEPEFYNYKFDELLEYLQKYDDLEILNNIL